MPEYDMPATWPGGFHKEESSGAINPNDLMDMPENTHLALLLGICRNTAIIAEELCQLRMMMDTSTESHD